jgi:ribonuclease-3|tara:strand:+ start:1731 stop:2393 length:663 start_codon:yes stop_codon:yes gene_type:complete
MNHNILKLEKKLKIKMKNKILLVEALTHKSANQNINNEKLEFLGDRVIGLILSKKLIDLYPHKSEGDLDKRFAKLVNRKTCASIAWLMGVKDYIIIGDSKKKINQKDEKILSDACEALIGAIYTDRGYNYVKEFVLRLWKKDISESHVTILDPKTKLQEYSLKNYKKLPFYRLLNSKGPKHNPIFKISVTINKSKQFIGLGNSKKLAEQDAAAKLLKSIN